MNLSEDQWFDREAQSHHQADVLSRTLIGMANADGGTIVVGLSEGVVKGTDAYEEHRNELMQAHVEHCEPAVPARCKLLACRNEKGQKDRLLVIEVRPGDTVYANNRDEVYLRVGDETRRLTYSQRQELPVDRGNGSYEARVIDGSSLDATDAEILSSMLKRSALRAFRGCSKHEA